MDPRNHIRCGKCSENIAKECIENLGRHLDSKKLVVYSYISFIFLPVPKAQILLIRVICRNMAPETQMAALVNKQ